MEVDFVVNAYAVKAGALSRPIDATPSVRKSDGGVPSRIARKPLKHPKFVGHPAHKEQKLSKREREVLGLLSKGFRYKEIGERLHIAPETVRAHVKNICRKMCVQRRVEAIAKHIKKAL